MGSSGNSRSSMSWTRMECKEKCQKNKSLCQSTLSSSHNYAIRRRPAVFSILDQHWQQRRVIAITIVQMHQFINKYYVLVTISDINFEFDGFWSNLWGISHARQDKSRCDHQWPVAVLVVIVAAFTMSSFEIWSLSMRCLPDWAIFRTFLYFGILLLLFRW